MLPDNYDLWEQHEADQQAEFQKLPKCDYCDTTIQEDHFFLIEDAVVCESCLNYHFRKPVEDYVS